MTRAVANSAAPTVAELEAGTPIRGFAGIIVAPPPTGEELIANIERASTALLGEPVSADLYERGNWTPPDILDRIDDTLMTYDSQHADGDQPWPYGSF